MARHVRLQPLEWHGHISVRAAVTVCDENVSGLFPFPNKYCSSNGVLGATEWLSEQVSSPEDCIPLVEADERCSTGSFNFGLAGVIENRCGCNSKAMGNFCPTAAFQDNSAVTWYLVERPKYYARLLRYDTKYCGPFKWLNQYPTTARKCHELIEADARCNTNVFNYVVNGDKNCGCVTDKTTTCGAGLSWNLVTMYKVERPGLDTNQNFASMAGQRCGPQIWLDRWPSTVAECHSLIKRDSRCNQNFFNYRYTWGSNGDRNCGCITDKTSHCLGIRDGERAVVEDPEVIVYRVERPGSGWWWGEAHCDTFTCPANHYNKGMYHLCGGTCDVATCCEARRVLDNDNGNNQGANDPNDPTTPPYQRTGFEALRIMSATDHSKGPTFEVDCKLTPPKLEAKMNTYVEAGCVHTLCFAKSDANVLFSTAHEGLMRAEFESTVGGIFQYNLELEARGFANFNDLLAQGASFNAKGTFKASGTNQLKTKFRQLLTAAKNEVNSVKESVNMGVTQVITAIETATMNVRRACNDGCEDNPLIFGLLEEACHMMCNELGRVTLDAIGAANHAITTVTNEVARVAGEIADATGKLAESCSLAMGFETSLGNVAVAMTLDFTLVMGELTICTPSTCSLSVDLSNMASIAQKLADKAFGEIFGKTKEAVEAGINDATAQMETYVAEAQRLFDPDLTFDLGEFLSG
jgi:hypothetical protein